MIVREKREPSRSYMFSGWLPGSGMSTFASTGDMNPRRRAQEAWGVDSEEQPPPAPAASPGGVPETAWRHDQEPAKEETEVRGEEETTRPPRKHKKKYSPKPTEEDDEEEYERPSRGGSGERSLVH